MPPHLLCFGALYARGCARVHSFGDGTSALAVVFINIFASLHLPAFGTMPIGWCRCSWNAPSAPVVFARCDSDRRDHADPGPRRMEMAACSARYVLTCPPRIRVGYGERLGSPPSGGREQTTWDARAFDGYADRVATRLRRRVRVSMHSFPAVNVGTHEPLMISA